MFQARCWWRAGFAIALWLAAGAAVHGQVELVSRATPIQDTNGDSFVTDGSFSADGRFVVFESWAPNLIPGLVDTNRAPDVFLHDRITGKTTLVSHIAGSPKMAPPARIRSFAPRISADGRYVAFLSGADNLVPDQVDENEVLDLFLYDRVTDSTVLISHEAGAPTRAANYGGAWADYRAIYMSDDASYVAYSSSSTNLADNQTPPTYGSLPVQAFVYERSSGTNQWVTRTTGAEVQFSSYAQGISSDGTFITFVSEATDLIPGLSDTNHAEDVFLYDRPSRASHLVSHAAGTPLTASHGTSSSIAKLSRDGRFVLFMNDGTDLVQGVQDAPGSFDAFLYDRTTDSSMLVSHRAGAPGVAVGGAPKVITPDGRYSLFSSVANNVVAGQADSNGKADLFWFDRVSGRTKLVSRSRVSATATSAEGWALFTDSSISSDGRYVLFVSQAQDLVAGQSGPPRQHNVYLYDSLAERVSLVSHADGSNSTAGDGDTFLGQISQKGDLILFESLASDLVDGQVNTLRRSDLFVQQRRSGSTVSISHRDAASPSLTPDEGSSNSPSISADGRYVVFVSDARGLTPGIDKNGESPYDEGKDVYLYDRVDHRLTLISHAAGSLIDTGNYPSPEAVISADGRYVAFTSKANDLIPNLAGNVAEDIFLYDRVTGTTTLVSHSFRSALTAVGGFSPSISADGRFVAFVSHASELVPRQIDSRSERDVFVWDRDTGKVILASHAAGSPVAAANRVSVDPVISADGRYVAYSSLASDLIAGQAWTAEGAPSQIYLFDRVSRRNQMVSHAASSPAAGSNAGAAYYALSSNGRFLGFWSLSTDLVAGQTDGNEAGDIFLYDRETQSSVLVTHTAGSAVVASNKGSYPSAPLSLSADGRFLAFHSHSSDLLTGITNRENTSHVYFYDRVSSATTLVSHILASSVTGAFGAAPVVIADGRFIVYESNSVNQITGDRDPRRQGNLLRYDRLTGRTILVSRTPAVTATAGNDWATRPAVSADGRWIAFESLATNLTPGDFNTTWDVFLFGAPPDR